MRSLPRSFFIRITLLSLVAVLGLLWSSSAHAATLSGVVYEAKTGKALPGVRVEVFYDVNDPFEPGVRVPADRLADGEQGQQSASDGSYEFDLPTGRIYRLSVTSGADSYSFPSTLVPPLDGFARFGEISPSSTPGSRGDRPFFLRFDATPDNAIFLNNHLAVDEITDLVSLSLKTNRPRATIGDVISFSAELNNKSQRSFFAADRRAVFLEFAGARGLSVNPQSATAELQVGSAQASTVAVQATRSRSGSDRVIRLGPFDVPAGSVLRVRYQVTVGIATKEGRHKSYLTSRDQGGVPLSARTHASVAIAKDRDFSTSTLLGRVYCDVDGNGRQGYGESGVFGARVYSDTGAIAVSDKAGRFHFTRILPGSHVFKLDEASLAGGKVRNSDRRVLRLTEGLPGQLDFPVNCGRRWIGSKDARVVLPLLPPKKEAETQAAPKGIAGSIKLRGRLSPMTLSLGGERLDLPSVELIPDIPKALVAEPASEVAGVTLLAVPSGGYQRLMPHYQVLWKESSFGTPKRWRFTIERVEAGGLAPVLHQEGQGAPPPSIEWNGLGDSGQILAPGHVYAARLTMISTDGVEVASKRLSFGLRETGGEGKTQVLLGPIFSGKRKGTKASPELIARVQAVVSQLGAQGSVVVEVHGDGSGDRFQSLVQTQIEAKIVRELFVQAGVPASRVKARGRGESENLDVTGSAAAKAANRRVVFQLEGIPGQSEISVPTEVLGKSALRIDGRLTPISADGGFETSFPRARSGYVAVDMLAASGRRAAFRIPLPEYQLPLPPGSPDGFSSSRSAYWAKSRAIDAEFRRQLAEQLRWRNGGGPPPSQAPAPPKLTGRPALAPTPKVSRTWEIEGNAYANTLAIDFEKPPEAVWLTDARLASTSALPIPEIETEIHDGKRELSSPLDFRLVVAKTLSVKRWELVVAEETGNVVHRHSQVGALPAVVRWSGISDGALALRKNQKYRYWLDIETNDSSGFQSAPHWFHVDPVQSARLLERRGRFFSSDFTLRAPLMTVLTRFAASQAKTEDRFSLVLEVVGNQPRVEQARAAVIAYLQRIGFESARYKLEARSLAAGQDQISIVRDSRPPKPDASVRINGRRVALRDGAFSESVSLSPDEPVVVEMTNRKGAVLRQVGSRTKASVTQTAAGELIAPSSMSKPGRSVQDLRDNEILASDTPARSLRVHLPTKGVVLGDTELALSGRVEPGCVVKVNDEVVTLESDGSFHVITSLPLGKSELEIRADDTLGGSSTIVWPVKVARTHHVALGLVEGIAASAFTTRGWMADTASIAGMGRSSTFQVGSMLLSARAQGYVKARLSGGAFSDTIEVTAQVDTGRDHSSSPFFEQIIKPAKSHPVLGDDAAELQDANTRGKVYARVVAGNSSAVVGSIHTRLEGGGDLFEYDRTTDGAVGNLRRKVGKNDVAVRAFSSSGSITSSRDVNWFRATGGSLYYLRHSRVLEGSEKVRIVIRDRDSGLPLNEEVLVEGIDYTIDFESGRIRLTVPLSSTSTSSWVLDNMDSSATPMGGHHVFLNVRYEHEDQDGLTQRAKGAYASTNIEQRLSIGAGIVTEERSDQEAYRLVGADASLNLGKRSNLRAEVAASRQRDASHSMSQDGGLSFGKLQLGSSFEGGSGDYELGWKLSLDLVAKDYTSADEFSGTTLSAYVQDLDRGFSSSDAVLDQGRFKFGGRIHHKLTANDTLLLRHEGLVAEVPRVGPTLADVVSNPDPDAVDERASYITSLQWARRVGKWNYKLEGMHQRLTNTAPLVDGSSAIDARRVGVGLLTAYEYTRRLRLRVGQQIVANTQSADPVTLPVSPMNSSNRGANSLAGVVTNVGADIALAPDLSITTDVFQRWNGDNAARVGLRTAISERGSMYLQEQVGGIDGRLSNTTIVGAEDRFGDDGGGRTYGEYQAHRGVLGGRNAAVMGLGRRWQLSELIGIGLGFEHQQAFGGYLPDGSSIGNAQRNVLHGSSTIRYRDVFRIGGRLELRLDKGDSGANVDPGVLGNDPRVGQELGSFADHGSSVVGAALVIPPGEQIQVLAGLAAEWKLDDAHTWLGRVRSSISTRDKIGADDSVTEARYSELTTGLSMRPTHDEGLEFLARYSYLAGQNPTNRDETLHRERSHVLAILPYVKLPHRLRLTGKLAVKITEAQDTFDSGQEVETDLTALLAIIRLGYQFYGKWDASAELRYLSLVGVVDEESQAGSLLELGYSVGRHVRLGAGYNLSHFSDDELGDLQRDSHGFFVRITGHY